MGNGSDVMVIASFSSFVGMRGKIVSKAHNPFPTPHWIVQIDDCPVLMMFGEKELEIFSR